MSYVLARMQYPKRHKRQTSVLRMARYKHDITLRQAALIIVMEVRGQPRHQAAQPTVVRIAATLHRKDRAKPLGIVQAARRNLRISCRFVHL